MRWVRTNISSIYYFTEIPIILKQHIQSDWITNEPRKPWGDVRRTLSEHGYSKFWRTSLTDGQMQVTTITLRPKRPRVKNQVTSSSIFVTRHMSLNLNRFKNILCSIPYISNVLRLRQNGCHSADNIFKCILLIESWFFFQYIFTKICS